LEKGGYVYIMTNKPYGRTYIGVTANLAQRVHQHRTGQGSNHCQKYDLTMLVYAERHDEIETAIAREKAMKAWKRRWKTDLISKANPDWRDLSGDFLE
jgi:putative endonuclease